MVLLAGLQFAIPLQQEIKGTQRSTEGHGGAQASTEEDRKAQRSEVGKPIARMGTEEEHSKVQRGAGEHG